MVLTAKFGCGCSCSAVQFASQSEVVRACGNALVLLDVHSQQQRLLVGSGHGIQCFACNAKAGIIAIVEQGYKPRVSTYRQSDLKLLQSLQTGAEFGHTAVALSGDGELLAACSCAPDLQLSVWHWRKGTKLATAALEHPVTSISFQPADMSCLLTLANTSSSGSANSSTKQQSSTVQLWRLDKLWKKHELHAIEVQLPADHTACCYAWAPEGVYIGCTDSSILCIDPESSAVISSAVAAAAATAPGQETAASFCSLAVNKDAVVAVNSTSPEVMFYSRAAASNHSQDRQLQVGKSGLQLLGSVKASATGCDSLCFGGPLHKDLVISTADGSLLLLSRNSSSSAAAPSSSNPSDVQVEPLADCHVGAVTGVASSPDGNHVLSCGRDGSVRAWEAASGQLVGKRDLGGRLSCCAVSLGAVAAGVGAAAAAGSASKPLLAVGSEAGVLRLLALSDLQRLPVMFRARLTRSPLTHVAFNPGGSCLAAVAAAEQRVALVGLRGCEQVDLLGYYTVPEPILSICWFDSSATSQAQLLISLQSGGLLAITPPNKPYHSNSSGAADDAEHTLELTCSQLQLHQTATDVPFEHLTVVPAGSGSSSKAVLNSSSGGSAAKASKEQSQPAGAQLLAVGSDGLLHRLLLPQDATGWSALKGKVLRSAAKLQLGSACTAVCVSPCGQVMLLAGQDGSLTMLPAGSAAAAAAAASAVSSSMSSNGSSNAASMTASGCGLVWAHSESEARRGGVLAWSAAGQWAASAAQDGSLLLCTASGAEHLCEPPRTLPLVTEAIEDQESRDDPSAAALPETAAAAAETQAFNAGAAVRQATLQRLQALQSRLAQVLEANAAAPLAEQLYDAELVINTTRLTELRAAVDTEVAALIASTAADTQVKEILAQRHKALCWDSMQTKPAFCTGLKSGAVEVSNFPLPAQDESKWAKVANLRRIEMIEAAAQGLPPGDELYCTTYNDMLGTPAAAAAAATAPAAADTAGNAAAAAATDDQDAETFNRTSGTASISSGALDGSVSAAAVNTPAAVTAAANSRAQVLLATIGSCPAAACKAKELLYNELDVTHPTRKLTQAELYKRMVWELKTQFNDDFQQLARQKHKDADRLADLASRMDELIKELVKIHMALAPQPAAAAGGVAAQPSAVVAQASGATACTAQDSMAALTADPSAVEGVIASNNAAVAAAAVVGAAELTAELNSGRLVAHWSPSEDLEDMLFSLKPGEVKASRYQSPAERARAAAEEAAAEEARRKASADDLADRALKQMMGGRLERAVDEVADLVASRPAWMAGDPSSFNEEQLRLYKEYAAKEQAAIEERLKRKAVMETELRTLKASAEDIATKFDEAVAALADRRLDVLMEVTALESRILRLLADYEVVAVTAGVEAEAAAAAELHAVQQQLAAAERELAETHQLHMQQQESLASLHAEERQSDRSLKREFAEADSAMLPKLITLYKTRLVPAAATATTAAASTTSLSAAATFSAPSTDHARAKAGSPAAPASNSAELEFSPMSYSTAHSAAAAMFSAAGGGAAAAAAAGSTSGAGDTAGADLRGPLGPVSMLVSALGDAQRPDGLDLGIWERFVEYRAARGRLELNVREQTAKLFAIQRQGELLLQRHASLSKAVAAASEKLESLATQRAAAQYNVELQMRLKEGQVEVPHGGVHGSAQDSVLVGMGQVQGLNAVIQSKGAAKLELLRQMKEFKRSIYTLQWENKQCDMEAEDITHLTQQLQLLHVTKDFQQLVKASSSSNTAPTASATAHATKASSAAAAAAADTAGRAAPAAANKEVQSLENLLKVREQLQAKSVAEKQRQLRRIEGKTEAKQAENTAMALHLAGIEKLLDDRSRLEGAAAAGNPSSDRVARSLMMQRQLRDISAAQAAEIAAAKAELNKLQQRCFPSFPAGSWNIPASSSSSTLGPVAGGGVVSAAAVSHLHASSATAIAGSQGYGGGVVASRGGAFAPAGSRGRLRAPVVPCACPDGKVSSPAVGRRVAGPAKSASASTASKARR